MGQYYRGVVLGKTTKRAKRIIVKQAYCCYAHNNGAKLMEHSYIGNYYVKAYELALANEFYGYPFVWVGDYADEKYNTSVYEKANEFIDNVTRRNAKKKGFYLNDFVFEKLRKDGTIEKGYEQDFIQKVVTEKNFKTLPEYKYLINLDKKVFVKLPTYKPKTWTIHPLPLLCAEGNQRGGGDYYGTNSILVGEWAYDRIGIANELPDDIKTELIVEFEEGSDTSDTYKYQSINNDKE
jgi:hypothetical protein